MKLNPDTSHHLNREPKTNEDKQLRRSSFSYMTCCRAESLKTHDQNLKETTSRRNSRKQDFLRIAPWQSSCVRIPWQNR